MASEQLLDYQKGRHESKRRFPYVDVPQQIEALDFLAKLALHDD